MVAVLFSLVSIGWTINLAVSTFVTSMVGQSMSLNIVADVGDKLGDVISKAAGFNGSWGNGIYSELIGLMLALLAWSGYLGRFCTTTPVRDARRIVKDIRYFSFHFSFFRKFKLYYQRTEHFL